MDKVLLCNIIAWTSLIASWGVQCFKFKDDRIKYIAGMILSAFSVGMFVATIILK